MPQGVSAAESLQVVKATVEHLKDLSLRIASQDLEEMAATTPLEPLPALMKSLAVSEYCWAVEDEVRACVAVFGVAEAPALGPGVGVPWLIGSDAFRARWVEVARGSLSWRDILAHSYPLLINYVHARNHTAIRWLRWLGFTIHPPVPFGHRSELFHPFTKETNHV